MERAFVAGCRLWRSGDWFNGNRDLPRSAPAVEPIPGAPEAAPSHKRSLHFGSRYLALSILIALTALIFAYRFYRPFVGPGRVMVAIMPVDNMSGRPDYDYVTDGMTEEIISQLGQVNPEQLGVIARTSSMAYKGTHKRVDEIGRELGAEYLLESSFRGSLEHIRITAQ